MLKADLRDTPPCPCCRTGIGVPVNVAASPGVVTVTFCCPKCGHQWSDRRNSPKLPGQPDAA